MLSSKKMMKMALALVTATTIACTSVFAVNVKATTDVNVRSGPGNSYSVLTVMKKGTSTEKLGQSGNWIKLTVNGKTGYTYKTYLTEDASTSTPTVTKTVVVTASALNVRSGAGTSYGVIGTLKKNATADVVGESNGWYRIKYGNGYGYISSKYTTDKAATKTVVVTASSLNVRSGAGTSYKVIGGLKKGNKVTVVETSGGWYKIKFGSGYGYISAQYTKAA